MAAAPACIERQRDRTTASDHLFLGVATECPRLERIMSEKTPFAEMPPTFDAARYMSAYPDVAQSGLDPRYHYEKYGKLLERDPAPRNDTAPVRPLRPTGAWGVSEPATLDAIFAQGPIPLADEVRHPELVSIIVPNYNKERWLGRAIHSALSQVGVEFELIVVDDGSTDGSVALAQRLAVDLPNVHVISLLRNFGCYYARNIGVLHACGTFITILDSDDIMSLDRIARQIDTLKSMPGAVASRCAHRSWTADLRMPISSPKPCEASLLWRRSILDRVGWYDSVRFGGDAEFRLRLQRTYGNGAVIDLPDELYFARATQESLTTREGSQVFAVEQGVLTAAISPVRKDYADAFTAWQEANMPTPEGRASAMRIEFPQVDRPFLLGGPGQNASPSLGQKRVGTMTSFPARRESLKATLVTILPQLDELMLYLNGYDEVPDFAEDPKIRVTLGGATGGDLWDNRKYCSFPKGGDAYVLVLDDNLIYPPDYAAWMIHYVEMLGRTCVVGAHGAIFPEQDHGDVKERPASHFQDHHPGQFVDVVSTGSAVWHNSTLQLSLNDFGGPGICDARLAEAAARQEVPLFCVPRPRDWLQTYERSEQSPLDEARQEPELCSGTYDRIIAPVRQGGHIRRRMEAHLALGYDADTLASAGISLREVEPPPNLEVIPQRRGITTVAAPGRPAAQRPEEPIRFHIIVNGWNCHNYVDSCLRSIAEQRPGPFSYAITLVDDGSDDGTYQKLAGSPLLPSARLFRISENAGPAFTRHVGIRSVDDPNVIVVLVDMDDALEPDALRVVAQRYLRNRDCLMTLGNWHDQYGQRNPQPFYTAEEIDGQLIREVELFNATALRTFRRWLYDAVTEEDLLDQHGRWLETCTDVALMYPLLDQCWSWEVEFIQDPIYRYTRQHKAGTLARFGKPHKVERLAWLKAKPPKPRTVRLPRSSAHETDPGLS
ncbi:hypothetical protein Rumeso_00407 [Rubellimicrobium mesophilum DSM 19309]|uniref:Glycosyltransferase 2-like domain-containing protein n=2 Tax=Rubellimicrobium TaxID=295418 RepID=A0A017HU86_9RHOB|nr:hypothetical protein Rumeso_00407 [Rubellimicrobium mesophilum DSM 19309]